MNIPLDEVLYFDAITSTPSTGAAVDADSTPTFACYEEGTDTDIGVGGNMTKRTSLTGNYRGTFTLSAANGFEVGKWYSVVVSAVVGGVTGKAVVKNFRLVAAEATAGYPVGTSKVGTGTGEINLSSGKAPATIAAGDYSGNTPQTGDNYARLGAPAGASVSADIAAIAAGSSTTLNQSGAADK